MKVGDKAPDFILQDQDGNDFHLYENLQSAISLIFYPQDDSLICTKQLCEYNSNLKNFDNMGLKLVGISTNDSVSHKKFITKYELKIKLLYDSDKTVSREYNALSLLGVSKRKIVIIDQNGIIRFINNKFPLFYLNSHELLKAVQDINWKK